MSERDILLKTLRDVNASAEGEMREGKVFFEAARVMPVLSILSFSH